MVRKDLTEKCSRISFSEYTKLSERLAKTKEEEVKRPEGTLAKIHQILQPALNEMFFTSRLVLVGGFEDVAYITTYLHLLDKWDDYRKRRCHIITVNGKSELLQPLAIAQALRIWT